MEQAIIAVVGAVLALFGYNLYTKYSASKGQKELDKKVAAIDQKVEDIQSDQAKADKETQEKVDAIDKEKSNNLSGSSLADWFNRRK